MAASKEEIDRWIAEAKKKKATHIISVCDTFDHDDYPVYVLPGQSLADVKKRYDGVNMQRINEVIDMSQHGGAKATKPAKRSKLFYIEGRQIEPVGHAGAVVIAKTGKEAMKMATEGAKSGDFQHTKLVDPSKAQFIGYPTNPNAKSRIVFINDTNY